MNRIYRLCSCWKKYINAAASAAHNNINYVLCHNEFHVIFYGYKL